MKFSKVAYILKNNLGFSSDSIKNLIIFHKKLLIYNKKYNLVSKSTISNIWHRHILDSAQIVKYIKFIDNNKVIDLGTGGGFPGLILAIFNKNPRFHVKLYEKSPVKRRFLEQIKNLLNLDCEIYGDIKNHTLEADYVVSRAFKKLDFLLKISRETIKKPHKLIVMKGKNAQTELNNASMSKYYEYKMESSITNKDSKILIFEIR